MAIHFDHYKQNKKKFLLKLTTKISKMSGGKQLSFIGGLMGWRYRNVFDFCIDFILKTTINNYWVWKYNSEQKSMINGKMFSFEMFKR